jgi:hypothetical protein
MNIEQFSLINTTTLGMQTDKILYHSQSNTLYQCVCIKIRKYISFRMETEKCFSGLGSSKVNFQYLADRALGTDIVYMC